MITDIQRNELLITRATQFAVIAAIVMVVSKFFAWVSSDALSMQASLIDSVLDLAASLLNFFVVRQALKPADDDHRFGHGKAEAIAGLAQATFIAGSGVFLCIEMVQRLIVQHPIKSTMTSNYVMIFATFVTFILVAFQRHVVKKTGSIAIHADSMHYKTDFLTNIGVLISLNFTVWTGWLWFDAAVGGVIACYIMYTSFEIGFKSLDILMDKELPDDKLMMIQNCAESHAKVLGIHDLRTRSTGTKIFIQLHLDLDRHLTLGQAHAIGDEVEKMLMDLFPNSEVLIHHDPR